MSSPHQTASLPPDQQQEFLRLFLACERDIRRTVLSIVPSLADADDIFQQTALALWQAFDRYDPTQPFAPWACKFARFKALHWIERQARWRKLLGDGLAEDLATRREGMLAQMDERHAFLEGCVERLTPEQQGLLKCYYFDRMPLEKIAGSMGRSVQGVYKMMQRIRAVLYECILNAQSREVGI